MRGAVTRWLDRAEQDFPTHLRPEVHSHVQVCAHDALAAVAPVRPWRGWHVGHLLPHGLRGDAHVVLCRVGEGQLSDPGGVRAGHVHHHRRVRLCPICETYACHAAPGAQHRSNLRVEGELGTARGHCGGLQILRRKLGIAHVAALREEDPARQLTRRLAEEVVIDAPRWMVTGAVEPEALGDPSVVPLLVLQAHSIVGREDLRQKVTGAFTPQDHGPTLAQEGKAVLVRHADVLLPPLVVCEALPGKLHTVGDAVKHAADPRGIAGRALASS
mmetsp:Transcript_33497/g.106206  ORF Transcript_33497/g.106206 Transcript_33497/m.106206 type:complete len:273 (+) Transcript_33497:829-1647(+)